MDTAVKEELNIGDQYKSKNGFIGTVERINGVNRIVVRNSFGKIFQTVGLSDIDKKNFIIIKRGDKCTTK